MKRSLHLLIILFCIASSQAQHLPSIHEYTAKTIDGEIISLKQFKGKKLMLVNTASFCAFTAQFAALELTYKNFKQFDFEIIGFPSNDFGSQDPNNDSIIHVFCTSNYGVTFNMMSKVSIRVGDTSNVYRWLQQQNLNGVANKAVDWNFNKFLINESGNWVKHFSSQTQPNDTAILNWILSPSSIKTDIHINRKNENLYKLVSSNPLDTKLEIEFNPSNLLFNLQLYTFNGCMLNELSQINSQQTSNLSLDVAELNEGIYLLKIDNGLNQTTKKIIIQH